MRHDIEFKGSYSLLKVQLNAGEELTVEPGAMVYMRGPIEVETSTGGIWKALKRSFLGGESFFMNKYISRGESEIAIAPELPGDIEVVPVNGTLFVQSTSYLASETSIDMDVSFGGLKAFFSEEGIFLIKLQGYGEAAISSFGAIRMLELNVGEQITIDTGHIVAFDGSVSWNVRTFGGAKSTLFGGEGLVCDFQGPGKVYMQTRNYPAFVQWVRSLVPRQTGSR